MRSLFISLLALLSTTTLLAAGASAPAISALSVSPSGSAMLAGGASGVYRSTDRGATWKQVLAGNDDLVVASLAFDPSSNDAYAATSIGLFRSSDGGVTWEEKDLLGGSMPGEIVFDPAKNGTFYAATADGLYVTSDRGATWKSINPNGRTFSVRGLAIRPKPFTLYVINEEGLFASADRGASWQALTEKRDDLSAIAFQMPATLHLSANGAHYLRSDDGGKNWVAATQPVPHFAAFYVAGAQAFGDANGTLWRSTDAGRNWTAWKSGTDLPIRALSSDPQRPGVLWAAAARDGVVTSSDGGKSWTLRPVPVAAPQQASQ